MDFLARFLGIFCVGVLCRFCFGFVFRFIDEKGVGNGRWILWRSSSGAEWRFLAVGFLLLESDWWKLGYEDSQSLKLCSKLCLAGSFDQSPNMPISYFLKKKKKKFVPIL